MGGERDQTRANGGGGPQHGARGGEHEDPLQAGRFAVQLAEGVNMIPGFVAQAEYAIAGRRYAPATEVARTWAINKPHLELLARSMDPTDPYVARAQAVLEQMRSLEPRLPRRTPVGVAEIDEADKAAWLAQLGDAPSSYEGARGHIGSKSSLGADSGTGRGSRARGGPDAGDIARGVLLPVWWQHEPLRELITGEDRNPLIDDVVEGVDRALHDPAYLSGIGLGAVAGGQAAIKDLQDGPLELLKLIGRLAMWEHLEILEELIDAINHAPAALAYLGRRWNDDADRFAQGKFHGEVASYIAIQLVVLAVTAAEGGLAAAAGPYAGVIRAIAAVSDPLRIVGELTTGVRLTDEALAAVKAARRAEGTEELARDATRGARRAEAGVTDAAAAERRAVEHVPVEARATDAPHAPQLDALRDALPSDLRDRVRISPSPVHTDSTVQVTYRDGVELVVGATATPRHIEYHLATVRALLRYQGLSGRIRRLLDELLSLLRLRPGFGTRGFEAELEVQKLTAMRDDLQELLRRTEQRLHSGSADPVVLQAELESVEAQLALHERALGSFEPGGGTVAAKGPEVPSGDPTTARRDALREGASPTPATTTHGAASAEPLLAGLSAEGAERLRSVLDDAAIEMLAAEFGPTQLQMIASRSPATLRAFADGLAAAATDRQAIASLVEAVRLNAKGTISTEVLVEALAADIAFRARHGSRVSGDFLSRFWRSLSKKHDIVEARAELRLAEDVLAGDTPLGDVAHVDALAESATANERMPEFRATGPTGSHLIENKLIGIAGQPITESSIANNARSANAQIRAQAETSGDVDGFIRLDGRAAAPTDLAPSMLAEWISQKIPSPRTSEATRWVQVLHLDTAGREVAVLLELAGPRFVLSSVEVR